MSLSSISQGAADPDLAARTTASAQKEARSNPTFGDTLYGRQVISGVVYPWSYFAYVIAVATEAAYESALAAGNERPGYDPAVISDEDIATAVQVNWPPDEPSP